MRTRQQTLCECSTLPQAAAVAACCPALRSTLQCTSQHSAAQRSTARRTRCTRCMLLAACHLAMCRLQYRWVGILIWPRSLRLLNRIHADLAAEVLRLDDMLVRAGCAGQQLLPEHWVWCEIAAATGHWSAIATNVAPLHAGGARGACSTRSGRRC